MESKHDWNALIKSEALLSAAQRLSRVGNWELDFKTGRVFWSDECFRTCGFEPGEIAPDYETFASLVHPGDKDRFLKTVGRAQSHGESYTMEFRIVQPDGSVRHTDNIALVEKGDDGSPVRMMGTIQDITERKESEQALHESEARSAEAQQIANMGDWTVYFEHGEQVRTHWSAQLCRIYGIEQDGVPQGFDAYMNLVHPDDRDTVARAWFRAVDSGKPFNEDHRIVRPNGEVRCVLTKSQTFFGGDAPGNERLVGSATDVTERKRVENTIADSAARMALSERVTKTGSWAIHFEGKRQTETYWSEQQCRIYGIAQNDVPQGFAEFLTHIHEDDCARAAQSWTAALDKGQTLDMEHRIVRPNGEVRFVRSVSGMIEDETSGRRVVGTTTDITERE